MQTLPVRGAVAGLAFLATTALPALVSAQTSLPFPMRAIDGGTDQVTGLPALVNDPAAVRELLAHQQVTLRDFAVPGGETVDLALTRVDLARRGFGFEVDGQPAPGLLDGSDLSVWKGSVVGRSDSEVILSFSTYGSRGWVDTGDALVHVMAEPGPGNDWLANRSLIALDGDLPAFGLDFRAACGSTTLEIDPARVDALPKDPVAQNGSYAGSCSFFECKIAVETDTQYYDIFGDLGAASTYMSTLLAAISARYEEQINTVLTFPYIQFYTQGSDPWSTPDIPGSTSAMLGEFESAWAGSVPNGATLGHFISGAGLGGGIAYLSALCDTSQSFSFAVSGNLGGDTPFPIAVGPLNWDFMVVAHETGHNFSSPHTHDLGIDNCAGGVCITDGTIMSYCHQCPGGLSNITTYFHVPIVVPMMQGHASDCLPFFSALAPAAQPTLIAPGAATPVQTVVQGTPVGDVNLEYRLDGGAFQVVAMSDLGGGVYEASVPAANCGDTPEWFFSMVDASCGATQSATFGAEVGAETVVAAFDFETSAGFTVGSPQDDATTGVWVRGDPVGTAAQPEDDVTALGSDCWFTGQGVPGGGLGDNDVDGGVTTLTSSAIDLSGGDARISYWRWYDNASSASPNADIFEVEVSNGGAWVDVETVGPAGPQTFGGWFQHEFVVSDFVAPNASVQVRFRASDEGDGSIVEAAVDEFRVFRVDCGVTCQADVGNGGPGTATLSLCGGDLSSGTTADLLLEGAVANDIAILFLGATAGNVPLKGGVLVPIPWLFSAAVPTDGNGDILIPGVPGGGGPASLYFQYVYPDAGQTLGYGFSNAVRGDFLP